MADLPSFLSEAAWIICHFFEGGPFFVKGRTRGSYVLPLVDLFSFSRGLRVDHSTVSFHFQAAKARIICSFFSGSPFFLNGRTRGSYALPLADFSSFSRGVCTDHLAELNSFQSEAAWIIYPFFGRSPFFLKGRTCRSYVLPLSDLSFFLREV